MTPQMTTQRWSGFADNERALLSRHLNSWILKRATARAQAVGEEREANTASLLPLAPIILITLFMLWMVVNPL